MTWQELLTEGKKYLQSHEVPDADWDAALLLYHILDIDRAKFFMISQEEAVDETIKEYRECLIRRGDRIPLQHILGYTEFMGLHFYVNENVLSPRQDTEILVEEVLKVSEGKDILDMCTGSGCIAISLAVLSNVKSMLAVDKSEQALTVAKKNFEYHKEEIKEPFQYKVSDLFFEVSEAFDIIVSNPPYIESAVVDTLMPEVRDHEPRMALDGTEDGLLFYRKITEEATTHLHEGGMLFYEIGYNQGEAVSEIMAAHGFTDIKVIKDLAENDRVVLGKWFGNQI